MFVSCIALQMDARHARSTSMVFMAVMLSSCQTPVLYSCVLSTFFSSALKWFCLLQWSTES